MSGIAISDVVRCAELAWQIYQIGWGQQSGTSAPIHSHEAYLPCSYLISFFYQATNTKISVTIYAAFRKTYTIFVALLRMPPTLGFGTPVADQHDRDTGTFPLLMKSLVTTMEHYWTAKSCLRRIVSSDRRAISHIT